MRSTSDDTGHAVFLHLDERLQRYRERKSGCIVERTVHYVDYLLSNLDCSVFSMKADLY